MRINDKWDIDVKRANKPNEKNEATQCHAEKREKEKFKFSKRANLTKSKQITKSSLEIVDTVQCFLDSADALYCSLIAPLFPYALLLLLSCVVCVCVSWLIFLRKREKKNTSAKNSWMATKTLVYL